MTGDRIAAFTGRPAGYFPCADDACAATVTVALLLASHINDIPHFCLTRHMPQFFEARTSPPQQVVRERGRPDFAGITGS